VCDLGSNKLRRYTHGLNERNRTPLLGTYTCSDTSNQRSALKMTRHLAIKNPLLNQSLRGGDFDLVDHGIKNEQLIIAHGSDIIFWKESDG